METVIVGANRGGITAANISLDHYPNHRVVMIDQNTNISYSGCGTALWVGRQIDSYQDLFYTKEEGFEKKGVSVRIETTIRRIDLERKVVLCEKTDGRTLKEPYDKSILAISSLPVAPSLPGQNLEHISFLKLFQDGQNVDHLIGRMDVQHVAVVEAGYTGAEIAKVAIRRRKKAKLFDIANTSLASYYDEWFTKNTDRLLKEKGVETHFKERVLAFSGTTSVERVVTDYGEYRADLVISVIGFRPNTALGMEHLKLFKNGTYRVDRHQRTSDPDVYAVGDCVAIYSNALKRKTYIALATDAVRSRIVAGHSVGGTALEGVEVQGSDGIPISGYHVVSTGLSVKVAQESGLDVTYMDFEDLQRPGFMKKNARIKARIVYERNSRRIVGTWMASTENISMEIHMFSLAIEQEVTISQLELLDLFFLLHLNQPYNYITVAALSAK